jgi:putative tricarboxylic transport membrane protein
VAAALVFALGARGFGSGAWLRNLGLGLALSVVTWWLFARGLGVSLPGGLLERIG